jgi:hypothetical protein
VNFLGCFWGQAQGELNVKGVKYDYLFLQKGSLIKLVKERYEYLGYVELSSKRLASSSKHKEENIRVDMF